MMQQRDASEEIVISGLDRSEGGEQDAVFQFHSATVWGGQRAVATGTGEVVPFVWVDIDGVDENGEARRLQIRVPVEDAAALVEAIGATVARLHLAEVAA